jgi:hypothetical protein
MSQPVNQDRCYQELPGSRLIHDGSADRKACPGTGANRPFWTDLRPNCVTDHRCPVSRWSGQAPQGVSCSSSDTATVAAGGSGHFYPDLECSTQFPAATVKGVFEGC